MKVVSQGKKIIHSISERKKEKTRKKRKYAVERDRNDQEKNIKIKDKRGNQENKLNYEIGKKNQPLHNRKKEKKK